MKTAKVLGTMLLGLTLLAFAPAAAFADHHEEISQPDLKCLKCHSKGLKKKLEDGEVMSLKIDTEDFKTSVHKVIGCTGCHRDVAKGKHPSREPIASSRAYSIKHNQACSQCHSEKDLAYQESIHAKLVAAGNDDAPLCSDCHTAHAIQPRKVYEPVSGEPCSTCHQEIYLAFEESVHGSAREEGNVLRDDHVIAPICSDCHKSHDITAASASDYLISSCLNCHEGAAAAHQKWLPNSKMHMESVSCPACHSPEAERVVDLQLIGGVENELLGQNTSNEEVQQRLDAVNDGDESLSPGELWRLLRNAQQDNQATDITLRGRLAVAQGIDAHRLAPSSQAVRSCESCHQGDSGAFTNVKVSISRPDGRRQSFAADSDVLNSPQSVDSVGGFYAPGGTRIKLLDYLVIIALVVGIAMPIGHILLGKIVRNNKNSDSS